ncbi:TPA: hypothetical protein QCG56_001587 [Enterobacter cancerogenus]|jgi:hypothetical protein|nr:hypothetical protein [Enterobacter cancerogenus]HDR2164401.1 hypothetical protein [Enterobacter cancerogenus]HDR2267327.1 hypothetical protein [Enterobacter cancerogenus]
MKRKIAGAVAVIALAATACVNYAYSDKPEFMESAESRVGSYLTSDYGKVACTSTKINEQRWELDCLNPRQGKKFQFAVYSAEHAPYEVSRSFYLEAINEDAKQSADQGLMRYLQINTQAGATQS